MVRQLHVLGVTDDGDALLLGPTSPKPGGTSGKPSHRVRLDDRLRAAVRGQLARPGGDQHRAEIALSPKEIQARLRAGETPEEVAKAAQVPVARLMPYVAPVEAERQRIVDDARAAHLHRSRGPAGSRPLGETVDAHLGAVAGLKPESVDWNARRRRDGAWVVSLSYSARGGRRSASWLWRPLERDLTTLDVAATRLAADETPSVRRSTAAPRTASAAPARKRASSRPAKKSAAKKPVAKKSAPSAKKAAAGRKATASTGTASARKRAASKAATTRKVATGRKVAATKAATARKAATTGKAATTRTAATARKAASTKAATARKAAAAGKAATKRTAAAKPTTAKAAPVRKTAAKATPVRKTAATATPVRKTAAKAAPVRKVASRKPAAETTVTAPNKPFRPTLVESPPSLTPVAPAPVAPAPAAPAPEPVVEPAAVASVVEPVAEPVAAPAGETRPNVVVVPPPAARRKGQRVPVPSWSDVLLGVQPHRDDDDQKG